MATVPGRAAASRAARQCTGARADGQRCDNPTKRRKPGNLGIPLCHVHGGN